MTTPTITAQVRPVQFSHSPKLAAKPSASNTTRRKTQSFRHTKEFSSECIKKQLEFFISELSHSLTNWATVSVDIDHSGGSMTVESPDFQFSIIYNEMNGGTAI